MNRYIICVLIITGILSGVAYADVVIVCNKSVSETSLTKKELRQIFLGKRVKWSDGTNIRFVTLDNPDIHNEFLKKYLQKDGSQWNIYWKRMIFTGRGMPPKQLDSPDMMNEYISNTTGAIGYIDSKDKAIYVKTIEVK